MTDSVSQDTATPRHHRIAHRGVAPHARAERLKMSTRRVTRNPQRLALVRTRLEYEDVNPGSRVQNPTVVKTAPNMSAIATTQPPGDRPG